MKPVLKQTITAAGLVLALSVAGCQTHSANPDPTHTRALLAAQSDGFTKPLAYYEKRWAENKKDPYIATDYAKALRHNDQAQRALTMLARYAKASDAPVEAIVEFAADSAATGNYVSALHYAEVAVEKDPTNPHAQMIYGIALDATGEHTRAEAAHREALKYWAGDPAVLLSNLALSLAHQGFLDQALDTMREAHSLSPEREDIARNVDILTELHHNVVSQAVNDPEKTSTGQ